MNLPYLQFYPADWLADTRALSLAAKGAWVDIICALHRSQNRGTMTMQKVNWARLIGATVDQTEAVINEIAEMQIADVIRDSNGNVTLTCRRMLREGITREQTRLRVARHRHKQSIEGSEQLASTDSNNACNGNGNSNVTGKKLETRNQKLEKKSSSDSGKSRNRTSLPDSDFINALKANPAYRGVDIDRELGKMDAWLLTPKGRGRKKTRQFIVNWLNKVDVPVSSGVSKIGESSIVDVLKEMGVSQ